MSGRRGWVIAAQGAAVALLVLVVYVTLLRPEGPSTLEGIEAPGGEPPGTVDTRPGGGGSGNDGPAASDSGAAPGGTAAGGPGTGVGDGANPPGLVSDQTPSDDQYDDAVKSLLDKVAAGGAVAD